MFILKSLLVLLSCLLLCNCLKRSYNNITDFDDLVNLTNITTFPAYSHNIRAGYLNLTNQDQAFYYIYCESQNEQSSDNDPVILWLNGGPGCSSMMGFLTENGPFKFKLGSTEMEINPYAWNKKAHVIYLESPGGVGFSECADPLLTTNDTQVAQDNLLALRVFFDRYQLLRGNDFYIAGQSYAGIYIPRLAAQILNFNADYQQLRINLRGLLIGNACTHPTECYTPQNQSRYFVEYLTQRAFFDESDWFSYKSKCLENEFAPACLEIQNTLYANYKASGANVYNIYGKCYTQQYKTSVSEVMERAEKKNLKHPLRCTDSIGSLTLLNTNEFRQALKVNKLNESLLWTPCSDKLNYTIEAEASYSTLPTLVKAGLKIIYFSGDHDAIVPITGTLFWFQLYSREYGAAVKKSWRPWVTKKDVSGMVWEIEGITFASVIGAGHMVPSDKPQEAEQLLNIFLGRSEWKEPDQYIE